MKISVIRSSEAPSININPKYTKLLWLDTSGDELPKLKIYNNDTSSWDTISDSGVILNSNQDSNVQAIKTWLGDASKFNELVTLSPDTLYIVEGVGNFIGYKPILGSKVRYVDPTFTGNIGLGISWDYPFHNLEEALNNVEEGMEIWVKSGKHTVNKLVETNYEVNVNNIKILGGFSGDESHPSDRKFEGETILDGTSNRRIMKISSSKVTIENITFANGIIVGDSGGAIKSLGSDNNVVNCKFTHCKAVSGGAVIGLNSIANSTFIKNTSGSVGSDIYCTSLSTIVNCTIVSSKGDHSIYCDGNLPINLYNTVIWNSDPLLGTVRCHEDSDIQNCAFMFNSNKPNCIKLSSDNDGDQEDLNYPRFKDLNSENFSITKNSSLIDKGNVKFLNKLLGIKTNEDISDNVDIGSNEYHKTDLVRSVNGKTGVVNIVIDDIADLRGELNKIDPIIEDIDNHKNDFNNPHRVTKEQLGLDKVENVSEEERDAKVDEKIKAKFDLLTDGNNSLDSKIDTHIEDYNNPHRVTKEQIGLGKVQNISEEERDFNDIQRAQLESTTNDIQNKLDKKADLDLSGKIQMSQIPDSLLGSVQYHGTFDPNTGQCSDSYIITPGDANKKGWYYISKTQGIFQGMSFDVGDWIINSGEYWDKVDRTDSVISVNNKRGHVSIEIVDIPELRSTLDSLLTKETFEKHLSANNPHNITAETIGLGDIDTRISTPINKLRNHVEDRLNPLETGVESLTTKLAQHIEDKRNPHNVTAEQIGLGTVLSDILDLISKLKEVNGKITSDKEELLNKITEHINDKNNPHEVTLEQLGFDKESFKDTIVSLIDEAKDSLTLSINSNSDNLTKLDDKINKKTSVIFGNYISETQFNDLKGRDVITEVVKEYQFNIDNHDILNLIFIDNKTRYPYVYINNKFQTLQVEIPEETTDKLSNLNSKIEELEPRLNGLISELQDVKSNLGETKTKLQSLRDDFDNKDYKVYSLLGVYVSETEFVNYHNSEEHYVKDEACVYIDVTTSKAYYWNSTENKYKILNDLGSIESGISDLNNKTDVLTKMSVLFIGHISGNKFHNDITNKDIDPVENVVYVDKVTDTIHKWDGSKFVEVSPRLDLSKLSEKDKEWIIGSIKDKLDEIRNEAENRSGLATLGNDNKISANQIPDYLSKIVEGTWIDETTFNNTSGTAETLTKTNLYVDTSNSDDNNKKLYYYNGTKLIKLLEGNDLENYVTSNVIPKINNNKQEMDTKANINADNISTHKDDWLSALGITSTVSGNNF